MTNFEKEQGKIEFIQVGFRILGELIKCQDSSSDIKWSTEYIAGRIGQETVVTYGALRSLRRAGRVDYGLGQWRVTRGGREAYQEEAESVRIQTGKTDFEFKNEVLSGCTANGQETKIHGAALPCSAVSHNPNNSQERATVDACAAVEVIRAVARYYEVPPATAAEWMETGEVHRCNRCGRQRRFHRKNRDNWQNWQAICIECRKRLRG